MCSMMRCKAKRQIIIKERLHELNEVKTNMKDNSSDEALH